APLQCTKLTSLLSHPRSPRPETLERSVRSLRSNGLLRIAGGHTRKASNPALERHLSLALLLRSVQIMEIRRSPTLPPPPAPIHAASWPPLLASRRHPAGIPRALTLLRATTRLPSPHHHRHHAASSIANSNKHQEQKKEKAAAAGDAPSLPIPIPSIPPPTRIGAPQKDGPRLRRHPLPR
ncbi:unnamed protein product, partial [Linum tenue]